MSVATDGPEEFVDADVYFQPGGDEQETDEDPLLTEPHTPNSIQVSESLGVRDITLLIVYG